MDNTIRVLVYGETLESALSKAENLIKEKGEDILLRAENREKAFITTDRTHYLIRYLNDKNSARGYRYHYVYFDYGITEKMDSQYDLNDLMELLISQIRPYYSENDLSIGSRFYIY